MIFLANSVFLGSAPITGAEGVFRAEFMTRNLPRGVHLLSAIYPGDGVFAGSSAGPIALTIQ